MGCFRELFLLVISFSVVFSQSGGFTCVTSAGERGQCKPLVKCVRFLREVPTLESQPCTLPDGQSGVCCPHISYGKAVNVGRRRVLLSQSRPRDVTIPFIPSNEIDNAISHGESVLQRRNALETQLSQAGIFIIDESPPGRYHRNQRSKQSARVLGRKATKMNEASKHLAREFRLTPRQGTFGLPDVSLSSITRRDEVCPSRQEDITDCTFASDVYRTIDGSCNNKRHPNWGRSNTALRRLLSPKYDDGISVPRGELLGDLPSAREASETLLADKNRPSRDYTLLLMQFGQFTDHDIAHSPIAKGHDDKEIKCCRNGRKIEDFQRHPECFPIEIPEGDRFFSRYGKRCMEFVRSMPAIRPECSLGPREQVSQITTYIDGSNVYGSERKEAARLRLGRQGRLRVTRYGDEDLLPVNPKECEDPIRRQYCFEAGDARVNEQIMLAVMHTIWLREHNRLVGELARINPHWGDERLFQEARKILGAELQHITYNEWLPIILGAEYMDAEQLTPQESGYVENNYDSELDPSASNGFSTAAFRFGHSLVQGIMDGYNGANRKSYSMTLHTHQFAPFEIYEPQSVDNFIRGLTTQPVQEFDDSFSSELTEHLFQGNETAGHGMDLIALNIQRGRDHGLPGYVEWRRLCGLPEIRTWKQLSRIVRSPELVPRLQRLYGSIDKIDLYLGGIMEKNTDDGILSGTFKCLVGDQFKRLKMADRFWYEERGVFTPDQLFQIRSANMARILCDNGKDIREMQPLPFKSHFSQMNRRVSCDSTAIPRVNLEAWRE